MVTFLVALEGTVVSTSMPRTVQELGGQSQISWAFSAYLGALAISGPLWGNLADRWGARPIYLGCVALFLVGCLGASLVVTMPQLILARFVQGMGGGGLTPLGQTVLSLIYDRLERARAQSWLVTAFGIASLFGPVLGGYLTEQVSWRAVFLISLPFGAAGAFLLLRYLKLPQLQPQRTPFDRAGFLVFVAWVGTTLSWADGWRPLLGWTALALGLILGWHSRRTPHPFLPLPLLAYPAFRGATALAGLMGAGIFGFVNYFPLFLQQHYQLGSAAAGRAMLPLMLCWVASSAVAPRWAVRVGYAPVVGLSALALALCFGSLLAVNRGGAEPLTFLAQLSLGLAGGLSFSPMTLAIQEVVPREQLGQATSAIVFLRTLGATLGTGVLGSMLSMGGFQALAQGGLLLALAGMLSWLPFRKGLQSQAGSLQS